jgi:ketosteroid isomerase-like protein
MAQGTLRTLYEAIEARDLDPFEELLADDVFALPGTAGGGVGGRAAVIEDLERRLARGRAARADLRLRVVESHAGASDTSASAWVFDQLEVDTRLDGRVVAITPVRITGLLSDEGGWRLRAVYWSVPVESNEEQRALLQEGRLAPSSPLRASLSRPVRELAEMVERGIAGERDMSELVSTREDVVTIGSTVEEIYLGADVRPAWQRFIALHPRSALRGGIRGALTPDESAAWLATHVDISFALTTPYRLFYIWTREEEGWRIVLSHNAVPWEASRA